MSSSKIEKILESHDLISDKSTYRSILTKGKKVAIFGAGQNYWAFKFFVLKKFDIDIDLVIDDKFDHLEFFDGIKVTSSSSKLINELKKDEYIIIITLGVTSKHQKIKKKLRNIGFKNIVTAYDFYEYHLAYASKEITYAGIKYYRKHSENIHTAYSMLQDDLSKEVYSQILDTYVTRRLKPINSRSFDEQYIPKDISLSKGHQSMINCGSFDGDTLKRLIKKGVKFKNIICIEPNLKNFIELTNWIDKEKKNNLEFTKNIIALPLCIGEKIQNLNILDAGSNSNIDLNNQTSGVSKQICVALDQILKLEEISFLNMDIEGAEIKALDGCKKLIMEHKPNLAISVYHEPCQLWEVLLKIRSFSDEYQFYLRNYTGRIAETVLYATT